MRPPHAGAAAPRDGAGPAVADRRERRLAAALVGLHVVLGLLLYEPILFPGGDNAEYMILGEALRAGQGYRDLHLAGQPLHGKYPPLYPLLLAALGLVGGWQLLKLASLALTAGCVWAAWALGRRAFGARTALLAATTLAVSPVLLEYSHWVLSEAPFTLLVLLALLGGGSAGPTRRAAGVAAGVGAFLTRTAGLPLVVALALHPLLQGRRREAAWAAAAGLGALAGWGLYQRLGAPGEPGYLRELLLADPYAPGEGTVDAAGLLARAASNVWLYLSAVLPDSLGLGGRGRPGGPNPLVVLAGLTAGGLALAGWLREQTRGVTLHGLFLALYLGLLAAWPTVWTDRRFLLPALPLLLLFALAGVEATGAWALRRPSASGRAPVALAGVLAVAGLLSAARLVPERLGCLASWRAGTPCDPPALASFYEAGRWASEHTPADAVIASRKPGLFFLFARRPGGLYRFSAEPALVLRGLEEMGATHVVVDRISATTDRYLIPAIEANLHRFTPAYAGGDPPTVVLRFDPVPRTAGAARPERPGGRGG